MTVPSTRPATTDRVAVVTERVEVTSAEISPCGYVAVPPQSWTWRELRDYVADQIVMHFGAAELGRRDPVREAATFKGFLRRYSEGIDQPTSLVAVLIAKHVFEEMGGIWNNTPVRFSRFCANSDPYFGDQILRRLAERSR